MLRRLGVLAFLLALFALPAPGAGAMARATPERIRGGVGDAEQVVLVRTGGWRSTWANLELWEKRSGTWVRALGPVSARVGRNGTAIARHEGDGTTPAGVFTLTEAFGTGPNPGAKLPFRHAGPDDWWVSDATSPLYNTWQTGPPDGRFDPSKGERLASARYVAAYRYAMVVDYNRDPIVPGAGSAIFVHLGSRPTSGCVATSTTTMLALLKRLDPAKRPVIAIGPTAWLTP